MEGGHRANRRTSVALRLKVWTATSKARQTGQENRTPSSGRSAAQTLFHELAHLLLGHTEENRVFVGVREYLRAMFAKWKLKQLRSFAASR